VQENQQFNVTIPAGLPHRSVLRIAGKGGKGFNGGLPGDVLIEVAVRYPDISKFSEEDRGILKEMLSK
jgi:molecular chaperone DnaJ/curved DNA-binding protein